jgi:hypothetical protein
VIPVVTVAGYVGVVAEERLVRARVDAVGDRLAAAH